MPVEQTQLALRQGSSNVFKGALSASNTDTTFSEITTGDSHEISDLGTGSELVTNGDFASDTDWTKGTGWTISGGTATHATGASSSLIQDGMGLLAGVTYKYVFTVSGRTVGGVTVFLGSDNLGSVATNETFTLYPTLTDVANDRVRFVAESAFDGSIDNVSVKPVSTITFAGGAELSSGSLDNDSYYVITATQANHFYTGCAITDRFLGSAANISQALDANNKVKLLHNYQANSVISIGGVESEALGAEILSGWDFTSGWNTSGTVAIDDSDSFTSTGNGGVYPVAEIVTVGLWYKVVVALSTSAAEVQIINSSGQAAGNLIGTDSGTYYFQAGGTEFPQRIYLRNVGSGTTDVTTFEVYEIPPILAKPYRIASIDSSGVCTLSNADFSDLAANITSGYTTSASLTNWTEGDGWMPGLDLDPTPVNSNSEFDQWTITNDYTSDFSAGVNGWTASAGAVDAPIDDIGGAANDDNLEFTIDDTSATHYAQLINTLTEGHCYRIRFEYYIIGTNNNIDGIKATTNNNAESFISSSVTDSWTSVDEIVPAEGTRLRIYGIDGAAVTFQDGTGTDVFYIRAVIIDEIEPVGFTVSGLSATNYLLYNTTSNEITVVSDGANISFAASGLSANANYFVEIGIASVISGSVYIWSSADNYYFGGSSPDHYQFYANAGASQLIRVNRATTNDNVTASYFRLYKVEDTYAVCDRSQSATTDLVNTEFTPTAKTGYKTTKIYESIDAGGSTSYIGSRGAGERTVAATYEEKIKTIDTTGATERGTSDLECKITSYTIEEYGG